MNKNNLSPFKLCLISAHTRQSVHRAKTGRPSGPRAIDDPSRAHRDETEFSYIHVTYTYMSLVIYLFYCTLNCFILFTINSTYFFLSGSYSCHIPQPTHPYLVTFTRTTYTKGEELTPGSAGPSPNRLVVLRIVFNMSRPKGQMPLKKIFVLTVRYFTIITHLCILISFS